jgi:GNAT superfamily N-acetyltransferase
MSEFNTAAADSNHITVAPASISSLSISLGTIDDINSILLVSNDAFTAGAFFKKPEYQIRFTAQNITEMFNSKDSVFLVARSQGEVCGSLFLQWEIKETTVLKEGSNFKEFLKETETIETMQYTDTATTVKLFQISGKFNALSVHRSYQKRGIGQILVTTAENYLIELSKTIGGSKYIKNYQHISFASPAISSNNSSSNSSDGSRSSNGGHDDNNRTSSNNSCSNYKTTTTILPIEIFIEIGIINLMDYLVNWYKSQGYDTSGELRHDTNISHVAKEGYKDVCLIIMNKVLK